MFSLLLFFAELFVLFLLSRTLTRALSLSLYHLVHNKTFAVHIMSFLFFPGTLIHELSHALMAGVLGVRVGKMEFVPKIEGDKVKMGSVQVEQTDIIRRFFIGIAPFLVGTTLLLGILYFAAHNQLFENWLMIAAICYVVFEIGNTMFSSKKDMEGAIELLITILIITLVFYFLGFRLPAVNPETVLSQPIISQVLQKGTIFLMVPIVIDILVISLLKLFRR